MGNIISFATTNFNKDQCGIASNYFTSWPDTLKFGIQSDVRFASSSWRVAWPYLFLVMLLVSLDAWKKTSSGRSSSSLFNVIYPYSFSARVFSVSLMAYCGPNSLLLGSIRFGGWNFSETTDLGGNIFWISVLFLVDFSSTLLSFILLKIFGGMSIFKMYYQVVQEMGVVLATQQGYIVVEVSKNSAYNTSCIPVP